LEDDPAGGVQEANPIAKRSADKDISLLKRFIISPNLKKSLCRYFKQIVNIPQDSIRIGGRLSIEIPCKT
jgi:hypothetical protein